MGLDGATEMDFRLLQRLNTDQPMLEPMLVTLSGIVMLVSAVQ